jgi:hypothetical protein
MGTQIGRFVVLRRAGAGAVGSVHLAEHSLAADISRSSETASVVIHPAQTTTRQRSW